MAETAILKPDARVELLNGTIFDQPPASPYHGGINKRLLRMFSELSNGSWVNSARGALRMDEYSEIEPDFMLLQPSPDDYASRHPQPEDVFLLIEVSDTTLDYDREEKLPAYGRAGVAEVWIINLNDAAIEVYREPHFTGYGSKSALKAGDKVAPQTFPDAVVEVVELLKR